MSVISASYKTSIESSPESAKYLVIFEKRSKKTALLAGNPIIPLLLRNLLWLLKDNPKFRSCSSRTNWNRILEIWHISLMSNDQRKESSDLPAKQRLSTSHSSYNDDQWPHLTAPRSKHSQEVCTYACDSKDICNQGVHRRQEWRTRSSITVASHSNLVMTKAYPSYLSRTSLQARCSNSDATLPERAGYTNAASHLHKNFASMRRASESQRDYVS